MNHLIQPRPLFGRRKRRATHGSRGKGRDRSRGTPAVTGYLTGREWKVLRQVHAHELRGDVEQQRCVELAAMRRTGGILEKAREIEGEEGDCEHARAPGARGVQSLQMRVVAVSRENNERVDATLLP